VRIQGARREGAGGVLDSTSRSPIERNAIGMPISAPRRSVSEMRVTRLTWLHLITVRCK